MKMKLFLALTVTVATAGLWSGASIADEHSLMTPDEIMKKLATLNGEWLLLDQNGEETGDIASIFRGLPMPSGYVMGESFFPEKGVKGGESLHVYMIEDGQVRMTHACNKAAFNPPSGEVRATSDENRLIIVFDPKTSTSSSKSGSCGSNDRIFNTDIEQAEYILSGSDRLTTRWGTLKDGEFTVTTTLELKRKN